MAFHRAHAGERGAAFTAGVEVSPFKTDALERKIMTAGFVRDAEIPAGSAPFGAVRRNLAATRPMLREKMGQFMAKRSLNLGRCASEGETSMSFGLSEIVLVLQHARPAVVLSRGFHSTVT